MIRIQITHGEFPYNVTATMASYDQTREIQLPGPPDSRDDRQTIVVTSESDDEGELYTLKVVDSDDYALDDYNPYLIVKVGNGLPFAEFFTTSLYKVRVDMS